MLENWPRPRVIGHRGASALAPENTLSAFELAIQQEADAIEFDVKLSSDKQVIVIHDPTLERTTNGMGKVAKTPLALLKDLDAGSKFSPKFAGEKIPTLEEVFECFGKKIFMNVELTNYSSPLDGLVYQVSDLVRKHGLEKKVIFSSFFSRNLKLARQLMPEVPCGLLAYSGWMGYLPREFGWKNHYQALHPYSTDVNNILVQNVHAAGKRIHVWTVNGEENYKRMLGLNIDGIFTDDPGLLRRFMRRAE
jgi:glycerophosphoryl diester phosphodiesterase